METQMKKRALLFGIHMHQPVDNFGGAVDEAIELCYKPFFETMARYSKFKFSVHCSGWLLDTIRRQEPELFAIMQKLTDAGSIEWISAGYYEPVLSSIPSRDRVAQIQLLNKFIKKHFGVKPKGLWLTERVWESAVVPDIVASKIDFALVDDYHFISGGYDASKMDGYYITEEGGKQIALFPISQSLRYALPFLSPKRSIEALLHASTREDGAAIIFDDAEKFGLWPKTHEWVYEKKWLEEFLEAVLSHPKIETLHYGEYLKKNRSYGISYLNNTSYFEMGEWSLDPQRALELERLKGEVDISLLKGGIWKNFFLKYHESNYLHKRMLFMSQKQENFDKREKDLLYKLQTNDVFWHGVFGGLYLPNLRDNAYRYLLELEKMQAHETIQYEMLDIDKDGYEELKVLTPNLSLVFSAKHGGQMIEFGSLDSFFNWQNTLMRRKEAYHEKILHPKDVVTVVEQRDDEIETIHKDIATLGADLHPYLHFDWHPKFSFIDHFSQSEFTLYTFENLAFREIGDFANQAFTYEKKQARFTRDGGVYLERKYDTRVEKSYRIRESGLSLDVGITTEHEEKLFYGLELNLHFAHPSKTLFNLQTIEDGLTLKDVDELIIFDDFTRQTLRLNIDQKCSIYGYILHTVSQSESGFDKVAQGVSLLLTLPLNRALQLSIDLEVENV
jgi:4-alpha-glucanotransferase